MASVSVERLAGARLAGARPAADQPGKQRRTGLGHTGWGSGLFAVQQHMHLAAAAERCQVEEQAALPTAAG